MRAIDRFLLVAAFVLLPTLAIANDPPAGFFEVLIIMAIVGIIVAEVAAVLFEASVYTAVFRIRFRTVLLASCVANAASLIAGWLLHAAMGRTPLTNRTFDAIFAVLVTILVETPIVVIRVQTVRRRPALYTAPIGPPALPVLVWTCVLTNLITNSAMQALLFGFI